MQTTYEIKLPQFEGPFDLLLFFIERDELDIYDIPIAKLTNDFLAYIQHMESLDIELASEFILVAATLMRIKAKMLIPRKEINEEGEEIDPREELVQRLIEYKRFKEVSEELKDFENERQQKEKRGNIHKELHQIAEKFSGEAELQTLTLYKLMTAFNRVVSKMEERNAKPKHVIKPYPYTIKESKIALTTRMIQLKEANFEKVFEVADNRVHCVFLFLAVLELVQEQIISIKIGVGVNQFVLQAA